MKIFLVVDDQEVLAEMVAEMFQSVIDEVASDIECVAEYLASSAWDFFLENQSEIVLVLTDVDMPPGEFMDGIDLLRNIRNKDKDLPVFIMTGEPANQKRAMEEGASGFFSKPFNKESFPLMRKEVLEILKVYLKSR